MLSRSISPKSLQLDEIPTYEKDHDLSVRWLGREYHHRMVMAFVLYSGLDAELLFGW
jgi:hypothetical protein